MDTPEQPPEQPSEGSPAWSGWGDYGPPMPPPGPQEPGEVLVPDPAGPPSPPYPVQLEISYPEQLNRWLPLVKWLLVIPHFFVLFFVALGAFFVSVWAFFAVLFTGRYPRGAFDYMVGTQRWTTRVLAYMHLMTDAYPPFSMQDDAAYPLRVVVEYPEHVANWRPLVQWLLVYPYLLVASVLYWLTGVLTFIAFFTILFTKRIPRGLFELMVPGLRWILRGNVYAYFLSDRYPPWVWG
jgi:Domain of unknown function (DUF4389)